MSHRNLVNYRGHHDWEVIKAIRLWLEPRHRPAGVCGRKWVQIATGTQTFFLSHARLWHHEHNIFLSSSIGAESGFHYLTPNQPRDKIFPEQDDKMVSRPLISCSLQQNVINTNKQWKPHYILLLTDLTPLPFSDWCLIFFIYHC